MAQTRPRLTLFKRLLFSLVATLLGLGALELAMLLLVHEAHRVEAAGLWLLACAVGGEAGARLEERLSDPDLGTVAALGLARLGATDALAPVAAAPPAVGIVARAATP